MYVDDDVDKVAKNNYLVVNGAAIGIILQNCSRDAVNATL